ncbi:MAG: DUF72 domain-containing protein [Moraxellaceae bacterium]|nr:DUF72 domain-containing protein [Moraxellaceae bacterium]
MSRHDHHAAPRDAAALATMRQHVRVGISGWKYEPWRGNFYPESLTQKDELAYASRSLPTIEINSTFYGSKRPENFATWYAQTPDDFVLSVKAPQRVTHQRHLQDVGAPVARFLASGIFELKEKLGPVLWQFPPWLRFDAGSFEAFLACLPHDAKSARAFVTEHLSADKAEGLMPDGGRGTHDDGTRNYPLRHAVEVRHESFADPALVDMLRRHGVALVTADSGGRWPEYGDVCADFLYLRLHGDSEQYDRHAEQVVDTWAARILAWHEGGQPADVQLLAQAAPHGKARRTRDVFCYFDNTLKEQAPHNAMRLLERLGIPRENGFPLQAKPAGKAQASRSKKAGRSADTTD